ncbi:hypothetical protein LRS06_09055 [Hymenobacter sp. J193]|uniref:hypothetical protein n=1 Tax=Hymenobacter sp. J193 TaxID=2898429 RepID=UPI002150A948|nr:hypothetical protein [Hymenobacter sp. J193]MCR5887924.1 hypothetical protein [Hymenobacter sp. J193]
MPSPLAEQQRIVAKLLGHCEALEQRIQESRRLAGPGGAVAAEAMAAVVVPPGRKATKRVVGVGDLFADLG